MVDITTGGVRDRLIRDAVYRTIHDGLAALGWFVPSTARAPVEMQPKALPAGEEIPPNTITVTAEDIPAEVIELGSELSEDRHTFWVDIYAENDEIGTHLRGDIRDLLRGKFESVGRDRPFIDVFDETVVPTPVEPAFVLEVAEVLPDRGPRNSNRVHEQHWFFIRVEIIDER